MSPADISSTDNYWAHSVDDLLASLETSEAGLTTAAAHRRRSISDVPVHQRRTELVLLLRQFTNPITFILVLATLISAALGEATDAAIILAIVLLSGLLSFWQEYSASRAIEALLAAVHVTVEVLRDGARTFVPSAQIVSGDVIILDTGDLIPGDCRLLEADQLLVDEAALTGESYPVEKDPGELPLATTLSERSNSLFQGTHIVRGSGKAVVVRTGSETEFGLIARELKRRPPTTRFERGLTDFGRLLLQIMVILVVLVFAANVLLARPLLESFLFSVAIAVGLTPQLLPAIVSVSLSLGARQMARAKVIVKRLSSIEDFGGMNSLCTDKTGTLTMGMVRLGDALDVEGNPSDSVFQSAYLNSFHHQGFTNPIDDAILAARPVIAADSRRVAEIPYDFQRKRLSVLVTQGDRTRLICKGAVEPVLGVCSLVQSKDGSAIPVETAASLVTQRFEALSQQGFRVIGVASKDLAPVEKPGPADEIGMTFLGFLVFLDPVKPGIARTLRELQSLGITLHMVTGDSRLAAAYTARAVGLDNSRILTGAAIDAMDDARLTQAAEDAEVFAEIEPAQKERIVRALRRAGRSVGFLGDGINDAPALHAADVGISVDTAVDVAKDSASIVLIEKDLSVLMDGVQLGRQTLANTLKYVFVTTSANFGNMFSMVAATLFLPYLPMLPMQILLLNFLSDLPATTISVDTADPEQLRQPGVWDVRFIRNFMIVFGLISSVFDLLTFAVLRLGFDAGPELFRSGWFLESTATELAVMLVLRTRRPFFRSRPGAALLGSSILVALVTIAIPYSPLAAPLGFVPLALPVLLSLFAITAGYILITEMAKARFYRPGSRHAVSVRGDTLPTQHM